MLVNQVYESQGFVLIETNNTSAWDLKFHKDRSVGHLGEYSVTETVEVKTDFFPRLKNMAIEVACRGKPSGLMTSKSDMYAYVFYAQKEVWLIKTSRLKSIMDLAHQVSLGGDTGSNTVVFLLDRELIREHFEIHELK